MLQVIRESPPPWLRTRCVHRLAILAVICCSGSIGQGVRPECFVELPVFDPLGNKVPFEITTVQTEDEGPNLLLPGHSKPQAAADGGRLYFAKAWLHNGLVNVTLRASDAADLKKTLNLTRLKGDLKLKTALELNTCEQRTSLRIGTKDTESEVLGARIEGRVSGCQLDKDWWIRAMPMFGGHDKLSVYEGIIHMSEGSFVIEAAMRGERHIVIIGKGKQPITAFGVDVMSGGGKTNVGVLDLAKICPR
jgi:hypothetical protein